MVANGAIKYSSFLKQNKKMKVIGDVVISISTETVETLGTNYPTPGHNIKDGIPTFGKSKMEIE